MVAEIMPWLLIIIIIVVIWAIVGTIFGLLDDWKHGDEESRESIRVGTIFIASIITTAILAGFLTDFIYEQYLINNDNEGVYTLCYDSIYNPNGTQKEMSEERYNYLVSDIQDTDFYRDVDGCINEIESSPQSRANSQSKAATTFMASIVGPIIGGFIGALVAWKTKPPKGKHQ